MAALSTVGRYLYALPFLVFGSFHFMNASAMAGMVPIPGGVVWVYLTGVAHIAAALAIMSGKMAVLATQLLGLMLLIFAVSIHLMGVINAPDQAAMQASMSSFLKDTALAGAAWFMSGHLAPAESDVQPTPPPAPGA